jgi:hypothetical protein
MFRSTMISIRMDEFLLLLSIFDSLSMLTNASIACDSRSAQSFASP